MMKKFLKSVVIVSVGLYLAAILAMYFLQRDLMYFPTQRNLPPTALGLSGVNVEALQTPDGETLVLWYAPAENDKPTLLFLHGNGGEIGGRADRFAAYQAQGFGVLFVSWRGYGGSTGAPSEAGLVIDAHAAYDWLNARSVDPSTIAVVGESLGTGVAVRLAAENPVGALVLGAPYTATSDVAAARYPWLPVRLLMKDQYRSIEHIGRVTAPTLVLHGTADKVIPYHFGLTLFDAIEAPKTMETFDGQGHEILFQTAVFAAEIDFLKTVLSD